MEEITVSAYVARARQLREQLVKLVQRVLYSYNDAKENKIMLYTLTVNLNMTSQLRLKCALDSGDDFELVLDMAKKTFRVYDCDDHDMFNPRKVVFTPKALTELFGITVTSISEFKSDAHNLSCWEEASVTFE